MQAHVDISLQSNERWSQKLLRAELAELNRENVHLMKKKVERGLTDWEASRLEELYADLKVLIQRIYLASR